MINQWLIIFCYFHEVLIPQTIPSQVISILTDNLRHWMKLIFICLMSSYHELLYFHTPIDIRSRLRGYYKNWSVSAVISHICYRFYILSATIHPAHSVWLTNLILCGLFVGAVHASVTAPDAVVHPTIVAFILPF